MYLSHGRSNFVWSSPDNFLQLNLATANIQLIISGHDLSFQTIYWPPTLPHECQCNSTKCDTSPCSQWDWYSTSIFWIKSIVFLVCMLKNRVTGRHLRPSLSAIKRRWKIIIIVMVALILLFLVLKTNQNSPGFCIPLLVCLRDNAAKLNAY